VLEREYPERIFLAEANQWPEDLSAYFGEGDECHMCFHFPLMPRMFLAVAEEDRYPVYDIVRQTPPIPPDCQWALFLRNHDELTLEMVSERERGYLKRAYATDPRALLNMGIRRRLAPLMENDRRKIELLNGVLMSLPGTPVVYYGDEIGMGDNVFLGDRNGVRTPMQWTADRNAGFSSADPAQLYLPPIMDAVYSYAGVNVEAQTRSPSSLLNWMKRLIAIRKSSPVFGRGSINFLYPVNRHVLAYTREVGDDIVLCVANLAQSPQAVQLDLSRYVGRFPVELFGPSIFPVINVAPYSLTLPGYAFFWFSLVTDVTAPRGQPQAPTLLPELVTIVLPRGDAVAIAGRARTSLTEEALPRYVVRQAWFDEPPPASLRLDDLLDTGTPGRPVFFAIVRSQALYVLALEATFEEGPTVTLADRAVARLRTGPREGFLIDATTQPSVAFALVTAMRENKTLHAEGTLSCRAESALDALQLSTEPRIQTVEGGPDEALFVLEDEVRVRIYRRAQEYDLSELDTCRRLLAAGFEAVLPIVGEVVYETAGRPKLLVAVAQKIPSIRGDAWHLARSYLDQLMRGTNLEESLERIRTQSVVVGHLVAHLHHSMAGIDRGTIVDRDVARWQDEARALAGRLLERLTIARPDMPGPTGELVDALLARQAKLVQRLVEPLPSLDGTPGSRYHGGLHLGAILVAGDEYIIDGFAQTEDVFSSPLRDIASLLTSVRDAASSAILDVTANPAENVKAAEQIVGAWKAATSTAVLAGYNEAIAGCPSIPADAGVRSRYIAFFRLTRSVDDVVRELDRRSTWLRLAVRGVLEEIDD
jgi:maltose alpha-D-glucosyltransferase / alpha-amylase